MSLDVRVGLALNEARNNFDIDASRHIAPPLAACVPAGRVCYPGFSPSATFTAPGTHAATRLSLAAGVAAGYRFSQRMSLHLRYDHFGTFGRSGSVGRVGIDSWSVALQRGF